MRLRWLVALSTTLVVLGLQAPALAMTGGVPDDDGHSNVAAIVSYSPEGRALCSATLIAPRVLLTAGHCTEGVAGRVLVDFDSRIADAPPLPFEAADSNAGFTTAEIVAAGQLAGTAYTYPAYDDLADAKNPNDVGVVVLDEVAPVAPAELAATGTLDTIAKSALSKTEFTLVGYGAEVRKEGAGPAAPQYYPLLRRTGSLRGQKVTPQVLQTNAGGSTAQSCFGDSGGPVFNGGAVVALTSNGNSSSGKCRGITDYQRVDVAEVQQWLKSFPQP